MTPLFWLFYVPFNIIIPFWLFQLLDDSKFPFPTSCYKYGILVICFNSFPPFHSFPCFANLFYQMAFILWISVPDLRVISCWLPPPLKYCSQPPPPPNETGNRKQETEKGKRGKKTSHRGHGLMRKKIFFQDLRGGGRGSVLYHPPSQAHVGHWTLHNFFQYAMDPPQFYAGAHAEACNWINSHGLRVNQLAIFKSESFTHGPRVQVKYIWRMFIRTAAVA